MTLAASAAPGVRGLAKPHQVGDLLGCVTLRKNGSTHVDVDETTTRQDAAIIPHQPLGLLSAADGKSPRAALPNTHAPKMRCDAAPTTANTSKPTLAPPLANPQVAQEGPLNFHFSW